MGVDTLGGHLKESLGPMNYKALLDDLGGIPFTPG